MNEVFIFLLHVSLQVGVLLSRFVYSPKLLNSLFRQILEVYYAEELPIMQPVTSNSFY